MPSCRAFYLEHFLFLLQALKSFARHSKFSFKLFGKKKLKKEGALFTARPVPTNWPKQRSGLASPACHLPPPSRQRRQHRARPTASETRRHVATMRARQRHATPSSTADTTGTLATSPSPQRARSATHSHSFTSPTLAIRDPLSSPSTVHDKPELLSRRFPLPELRRCFPKLGHPFSTQVSLSRVLNEGTTRNVPSFDILYMS